MWAIVVSVATWVKVEPLGSGKKGFKTQSDQ